jgi:hypothetical protein
MLRFVRIEALSIAAVVLALSGCHGSGGDDPPPPPPTPTTFTVGGNITGLTQGSVILRLNGANDLTLNGNASGAVPFTFTTPALATGAAYTVSIATQPNGMAQPVSLVCGPNVTNNTGTINAANVNNIAIACASYSVGGTVSGLKQGSQITLQLNGSDTKLHNVTANGAFTFPAATAQGIGVAYLVHIKTQPAGQTCMIEGSLGIVRASDPNVTTAAVVCVDNVTDPLSGTYQITAVYGRPAVDLRNFITFYPDGTFIFGIHESDNPDCGPSGQGGLEYGVYSWNDTTYEFRVARLRKFPDVLECGLDETTVAYLVKRSDGTLNLASDEGMVELTPVPSAAGELTGSWGDNQSFVAFAANGTFFAADTRAFPPAQIAGNPVGIEDGCYTLTGTRVTGSFTVNVTSSCAVSSSQTAVDTNGTNFGGSAFATAARSFTVNGDTMQFTLIPNNPAMVPTSRIPVAPTQAPTFSVGGTITGLDAAGTGVTLRLNFQTGADFNAFRPGGSGDFVFNARLESGASYAVSVQPQNHPSNPSQFCTPAPPNSSTGIVAGAGTIVASDVTAIRINCTTSTSYPVLGTVTGLSGTLTLRVRYYDVTANGGAGAFASVDQAIMANGAFSSATIPANVGFYTGIVTQPAGQTCTIARGTGFSVSASPNLTNIGVACTNNVTDPLSGTYTLLDEEGRQYVHFNANGTLTTVFIHRDPDPENEDPLADCSAADPLITQRNGNGIEYGIFNWDQATSSIALVATPQVDTNGDCGFWEPDEIPPDPWGIAQRVGNTIQLSSPPGDPDPFSATATAVESVAGSIVGGWVPDANNGMLLVFHADGTFLFVETQHGFLPPSSYGQERGCYTVSNPNSTITLTISPACRPDGFASYDLNAAGGAFPNGIPNTFTTVGPAPFTMPDANTLEFQGRVFKRTQPN